LHIAQPVPLSEVRVIPEKLQVFLFGEAGHYLLSATAVIRATSFTL